MRAETLSLSVAILISAFAGKTSYAAASPVATEIWRRGDDGLTSRFYDAVVQAIRQDPTFALKHSQSSQLFKIFITDHMMSARNDGKEQALYSVDFSMDGHALSTLKGWCWKDDLKDCASQVAREATHLVQQMTTRR
jgi:hypothetical protein